MKNRLLTILLTGVFSLPGLAEEDPSKQLVRIQIAPVGADLERNHVSELYRPICLGDGAEVDLTDEEGHIRVHISVRAGQDQRLEVTVSMEDRQVLYDPWKGAEQINILETHPARSVSIVPGQTPPAPLTIGTSTIGPKETLRLHLDWPAGNELPLLEYVAESFDCLEETMFRVLRVQEDYDELLHTMKDRMKGYIPGREIPPVALGTERMILLATIGEMDPSGTLPDGSKETSLGEYARFWIHIKRVRTEPDRLVVVASLKAMPDAKILDIHNTDLRPAYWTSLDAVLVPRTKLPVEFQVNGFRVFVEGEGVDPIAWSQAIVAGLHPPHN